MTFARLPMRLRLTLAFAIVMALVLGATGLFLRLRLEASLDASLRDDLQARVDDVRRPLGAGEVEASAGRPNDDIYVQVLDERGRVVAASAPELERPLLTKAELARARLRGILLERESAAGLDDAMLLAAPAGAGDARFVVVAAAAVEDREEVLDSLFDLLLAGGAVALLLASIAGYALAAASLRPVEAMRRRATAISASTPGERLPLPAAQDEIRQLGETLNAMLARVELTLERERRLVADASHELRTPLARLKTELELALRQTDSVGELKQAVRSASEETDLMAKLADDLLLLAQTDERGMRLRREATDVGEVFATVAARHERRAIDAGREIDWRCAPGLAVAADRRRLEQALGNLVENALEHGAGTVGLLAFEREDVVELHVRDEGTGFPPTFLARAFERFSRADEARVRGGVGLGLAIVDAVARGHGGTAGVANRDGAGADVWLSLPRTP